MSWEIFVQEIPAHVKSVSDMPDDFGGIAVEPNLNCPTVSPEDGVEDLVREITGRVLAALNGKRG